MGNAKGKHGPRCDRKPATKTKRNEVTATDFRCSLSVGQKKMQQTKAAKVQQLKAATAGALQAEDASNDGAVDPEASSSAAGMTKEAKAKAPKAKSKDKERTDTTNFDDLRSAAD